MADVHVQWPARTDRSQREGRLSPSQRWRKLKSISSVYFSPPFQPLDFESKKAYTFKVDATNAHLDPRFQSFGAFKDTATVKINVLDVDEPPVFNKPSYVMDVYEDTPVGTIIGAVTAQDLDAGSSPVR